MKIYKILAILFGAFMIVGGLYCMFTPTATFMTLGWCIGLMMIFDAIGNFTLWWDLRETPASNPWMLVGAILSLAMGILVLAYPALQIGIDAFIAYFIAFWLIGEGIICIVRAFKLHKLSNKPVGKIINIHWYVPLCLGILMIIIGGLCITNPVIVAASVGFFIGLGILFTGADIITVAVSLKEPKDDSTQQ